MVLTTPMLLTQIHGIVLVLLNHTRMRGPSVAHTQDFVIFILQTMFYWKIIFPKRSALKIKFQNQKSKKGSIRRKEKKTSPEMHI